MRTGPNILEQTDLDFTGTIYREEGLIDPQFVENLRLFCQDLIRDGLIKPESEREREVP